MKEESRRPSRRQMKLPGTGGLSELLLMVTITRGVRLTATAPLAGGKPTTNGVPGVGGGASPTLEGIELETALFTITAPLRGTTQEPPGPETRNAVPRL